MNLEDCDNGPALLDFDHITVSYNGKPVLDDLTFQVPHGEQVAVVGPNGAGKSTLFKALVGLLPLRSGQIRIHCKPLGAHTDCVAYVPQREEVDLRFPVTVEDVVSMGRYGRSRWRNHMTAQDREVVRRSMDQLGVLDLARQPIGDLSGGQQQRVFLARALAQEPHILLMDEPFNGVDVTTQEVTMRLLETLRQQSVTVMVSTHDLTLASERFPRVLLLNRRLVSYGPPREALSPAALAGAFGKQVFFTENAVLIDQCCGAADEPEHHHHHEAPHD